jgi:hypothetical protein
MSLGFYFSSPLKMGMDIGILELYGFGEGKICPGSTPLPCLRVDDYFVLFSLSEEQ